MNHAFSAQVNIREILSHWDVAIIVISVALYLLIPKIFKGPARDASSDQDYILMGRGLSLPLFVGTLVATWYGGIFGVTQIAFENGVYSFFTQGLFWYVAYFIFAVFLAKTIRRKKVLSLPELIGEKFGPKARQMSAAILFFHALPVTYAVSVGLLLQITLGINFYYAVALGVFIVASYTAVGGFRGVVFTDCMQIILMFAAVILVALACFNNFGGLSFLKANLPPHYFAWRGENQFTGAIIWLFIACTSTFIHPVFYQRCLAAKSDNVAVMGILYAMGLWFLFDICTTLGGMYARALLPTADSAQAYLLLGVQILPDGLRGLFVSGILATILSTLDSFMFVSGTSLSYDLVGSKFLRQHTHKIAIFVCAALVFVVASIFGTHFESIWLFMEGAFSTSLLIPVLAALLFKKRFSNTNFMLPAGGALLAFFTSTLFHKYDLIAIEPFYVAHITAFVLFMYVLLAHSDLKTFSRKLPLR